MGEPPDLRVPSVPELTDALAGVGYLADRGLATSLLRRAPARPAGPARGRGRRRQDRGRQGDGRGARPAADPAAVLRGHRHQPGALRVGLRPPDAPDPRAVRAPARRRRLRSTQLFGPEFLLERPLLDAVRAGDRAVLLVDEVDRADDEFEAFLLELLSDFQITIPEIGTDRGRAAAVRGAHLQPHPRAARRPQAPLPLPLGRLSRAPSARSRSCWSASPASPRRWPARSSPRSTGCARSSWPSRPASPRPSTGSAPSASLGADDLDPEAAADTLGAVVKDRDDLELVERRPGPDHLRCLTRDAQGDAWSRRWSASRAGCATPGSPSAPATCSPTARRSSRSTRPTWSTSTGPAARRW